MRWRGLKVQITFMILSSIFIYWVEIDYKILIKNAFESWKTKTFSLLTEQVEIEPTSVHCWGQHHTNRICYFNDLYFSVGYNGFLFVHGEGSIYQNVPEDIFKPALLDMSSVEDHNTQYFTYIDVELGKFKSSLDGNVKNMTTVDGITLSMKRFLPGNLMHIFHDDLLPIFNTLDIFQSKNIFTKEDNKKSDIKLFFADDWPPGEYSYLYEIFTEYKPMFKSELFKFGNDTLIHFPKILIGVLKDTTWYQYGFKFPQGPLNNAHIDGTILRKFTDFYRQKMNISNDFEKKPTKSSKGILLVRHKNRLIMNEVELLTTLVNELGVKVRTMSLESQTLNEIINEISNAKFVIGMHGSLLILSIFLPPGSILVELFPYAINTNNYTPYCTLASIKGMNISYISWRNTDPLKSIPHPSRTPEEGGISHLAPDERRKIEDSSEVPEHLCCQDSAWLFRIYQDTFVDANEVVGLMKSEFNTDFDDSKNKYLKKCDPNGVKKSNVESKISYFEDIFLKRSDALENLILRPYRVSNIECMWQIDFTLKITWEPPFNVQYLTFTSIHYDIILQKIGGVKNEGNHILFKSSHDRNIIVVDNDDFLNSNEKYLVWIRCVVDDIVNGPFNNVNIFC